MKECPKCNKFFNSLGYASHRARCSREKVILRELNEEAQWIGEDGDMTCVSSTERGAWIKFKRLMRGDVGDIEADEMKENGEVGIGWLHMATEKDKELFGDGDVEWYVTVTNESPYQVWMYQN